MVRIRFLRATSSTPTRTLRVLAVAASLLPTAAVQAQRAPIDTSAATPHLLPTAVVEAARLSRYAVGSRRTTLDSVAVNQLPAGTLAEALSRLTPIYLKNYGPGQLSSITLRGTSARHTAVLWNGFNINLPTLGEADFALLPVNGATRITVQPGPASAVYGNGALGGTVLLSSPVQWGAGWRGQAQADVGNYGMRAGSVENSFSNEKLALRTAASYREGQNDFPYQERTIDGLVERRQTNAAYRQWSLTQDATLRLGQHSELMGAVWLTDADRRIQPAIGAANDNAQERDQSRRLFAGYRHVAGRHETGVRMAWFKDILNYRSNTVAQSNSRVRTSQIQADHSLQLRSNLSVRVGGEAQHFAARVDGYGQDLTENRFSGYALVRYDPMPTLRLTANIRQAFIPGRRPPLAPTLGGEWQVWQHDTHTLVLKGSAARSYRVPTLNERYWRPGGNPNLLPETSLGYEGGVQHTFKPIPTLSLVTELTAYRQQVRNWVQWLPGDTVSYWSPRNLRRVQAQGIELSSELGWQPGRYNLTARAAYAYTRSQKVSGYIFDPDPVGVQLPYVPLHTVAFTTRQSWRGWQLLTQSTFTSFRYTDASATTFLPSYFLLSGSLGYTFHTRSTWSLTALVQGFNLTNLTYNSYEARAMPPRNGVLSLRVSWR
ncbi:TonB-dependent receptor plug domain-containing protein [Hymenobacter profundi]|uniref:TonB-dependent receptor n=1 Tax=Hymenobacter profundi TaxID=1982110 RepID=A0ABS6X057_9BACT|nr:TonB-dependent receptor [Hymenobacter profundi]MBW3129232.1 TonB-dependent receptor [Hymenobacter profundi]